jgi:hypothetical protein
MIPKSGYRFSEKIMLKKKLKRNADSTQFLRFSAQSFRLDIGRPNHLTPFFGFGGDELAEVGWRA